MADEAVARGRNAGGAWIVAAVVVFGAGLFADSVRSFAVASLIGLGLFTIGLVARARYWRRARRRLGDATIQRALWRSVEGEYDGSERIAAAVAVVLVLLAFEIWRN